MLHQLPVQHRRLRFHDKPAISWDARGCQGRAVWKAIDHREVRVLGFEGFKVLG